LAEASAKCTFFILGWLAEREPEMVRAIRKGGHEIACHGWDHRKVTQLRPEAFRDDVRRSKEVLEDISGEEVIGYRAPSFSIVPGTEWALDILVTEGFMYDSSMFPVRVHPGYGYPDAQVDPHVLDLPTGRIWEVPPATLRLGALRLPAAGGAYLRFFPVQLVERALRAAEKRGKPGTVYLHPWELEPNMPRFKAPPLTQIRMKMGIKRMRVRLSRLLSRFTFQTIRDTLSNYGGPV
jgi:polysaccharide deacetylase family protein (PEP-CTERM system associated)